MAYTPTLFSEASTALHYYCISTASDHLNQVWILSLKLWRLFIVTKYRILPLRPSIISLSTDDCLYNTWLKKLTLSIPSQHSSKQEKDESVCYFIWVVSSSLDILLNKKRVNNKKKQRRYMGNWIALVCKGKKKEKEEAAKVHNQQEQEAKKKKVAAEREGKRRRELLRKLGMKDLRNHS